MACALVSSLAQAQAHLIPGAFRQLQQLILPDQDHAVVDASSPSSKPTLEQLKEEASQLEGQLLCTGQKLQKHGFSRSWRV